MKTIRKAGLPWTIWVAVVVGAVVVLCVGWVAAEQGGNGAAWLMMASGAVALVAAPIALRQRRQEDVANERRQEEFLRQAMNNDEPLPPQTQDGTEAIQADQRQAVRRAPDPPEENRMPG